MQTYLSFNSITNVLRHRIAFFLQYIYRHIRINLIFMIYALCIHSCRVEINIIICLYCLTQIILSQIEPLSEQQILGICGLQQSTQEAEEALSQGLEALNHSLSETITSDSLSCPPNMANYMGQMAVAMNKLSTLEGFVRQVRYINMLHFYECLYI